MGSWNEILDEAKKTGSTYDLIRRKYLGEVPRAADSTRGLPAPREEAPGAAHGLPRRVQPARPRRAPARLNMADPYRTSADEDTAAILQRLRAVCNWADA